MEMLINEFRWVLSTLAWLLVFMGIVFVLWFANVLLGIRVSYIIAGLLSELRQARRKEPGIGSMNIVALMLISVLGIVAVIVDGLGAVNRIILRAVGEPAASSVEGQIDPGMCLLALVAFAVFSVAVKWRADR